MIQWLGGNLNLGNHAVLTFIRPSTSSGIFPSIGGPMKTYIIAAVLFIAPIVGVIAMNPSSTEQCVKDAKKWLVKTFPTPKPKPRPVRC